MGKRERSLSSVISQTKKKRNSVVQKVMKSFFVDVIVIITICCIPNHDAEVSENEFKASSWVLGHNLGHQYGTYLAAVNLCPCFSTLGQVFVSKHISNSKADCCLV